MRAASSWFVGFAAVCLIGCGGSSTGGPDLFDDRLPGIGGEGTFLDESVRLETIRAARAAQSMGGATRVEQDAAMVAFFQSSKNIEEAGISNRVGNVWARFIDGTLYMDFSVRDQDAPVVRSPITPRAFELPGSLEAITGNSLQSWWPDTSVSIAAMLKKDSLYNVTGTKVPLKVADFEAMKNVGVLYWQTHSAEASLREKQRDAAGNVLKDPVTGKELRKQAFSYQTSEIASMAPSQTIKDMRDKNLLTVGDSTRVQNSVLPADSDAVYGITALFITSKMASAFAPDSLVAIDSCTGGTAEMVAAWEAVNVGGFVSWDNLSGDKSGLQFERLFDRLLGLNAVDPISTPHERPFAFEVVRDWMKGRGYDLDPSAKTKPTDKAAQLVFWNKPAFGILRPSITNTLFEASKSSEPYGKLLIQGAFGSDPGPRGKVEWGGTALTVVRWTFDGVVVRIPPGPVYPTGALVVSVDGRKSQQSHFTEWRLPLTFTKTDKGSLTAVMTVNCYLRADVRGQRYMPEEALHYTPMTTNTLMDSTADIKGSGTYVNPTTGTVETTWSGNHPLQVHVPLDGKPAPLANYFSCTGYFDHTGLHPLKLLLPISGSYTVTTSGSAEVPFSPQLHYLMGLSLPVDWSTRTITGGSTLGVAYGASEKVTVSWPTVAPVPTTGVLDQDGR